MTFHTFAALAAIGLVVPLAACGPTEEQSPPEQTMTEAPPTQQVVRQDMQPVIRETPVARMAPAQVIQSQPGSNGAQFDLIKVAVTGDILTVTLQCTTEGSTRSQAIDLRKVSVIDDATSQRIGVLKDNADNWLASDANGDFMRATCRKAPGILWAKFPAPPATSQTVSINLPNVAPFDGVPVTR